MHDLRERRNHTTDLRGCARIKSVGATASPTGLTPPAPPVIDTPGGIGAGVVFSCLLDASGHVQNLRVINSASPSPALEDAVRKWLFHPVLNGGQPVDVDALVGIGVGVE